MRQDRQKSSRLCQEVNKEVNLPAYLYVGLGGVFGAVFRYSLGKYFSRRAGRFPLGTLVINVSGAFALSLLFFYFRDNSSLSTLGQNLYLAVTTGTLGAYTTFSTFTVETLELLEEGNLAAAGIYVGGNLCLGLIGVLLGKLAVLAVLALQAVVK